MRVHSFDRIQHIWYALRELRYNSSMYYNLRFLDDIPAGRTLTFLATMEQHQPRLYAAYIRLLKEDGTLANLGFHSVVISVDPSAGTINAWLDSLKIMTLEAARANRNLTYQRMETRTVSIPKRNFIEHLKAAFPGVEFDVTMPDRSRYYNYGMVRHRFDRSTLGEVPENLEEFLPSQNWRSFEIGPFYTPSAGGRNRNYHAESIGVGANGRLYSAPESDEILFFGADNIGNAPQDPEAIFQAARDRRRESILDRMRAWRTSEYDPDEEATKKNLAQAASAARFEKYRAAKEAGRDKTLWISTLPFVEAGKGIKSSRRWGIEVETGAGRDLSGVPAQWDSKGDGSLESAYGGSRYVDSEDCYYSVQHDEPEYIMERRTREVFNEETQKWETEEYEEEVSNDEYIDPYYCDSCGEMDGGDWDDDDCVELVSPILNSMHSKGLKQICADIENSPRTDSAGVHVHVEAKDLTVRQIKELVMGYDHIEHLLESSYDRRERGYCKRRSARELLSVVRQPEENVEPRRMQTGDRYVTVNLQALYSHGTIEFRAMGPKYNYDHLIRWAMFCREMLNVFANGATSKHFAQVKTWNDVLAIFAKFGSEYNFATVGQMESEVEFEDFEVTV